MTFYVARKIFKHPNVEGEQIVLLHYPPKDSYDFLIAFICRGMIIEGSPMRASKAMDFIHKFPQWGAEWFIPYLKRMAEGDIPPIEEIKAEHFRIFGRQMEAQEGPLGIMNKS